MLFRQVNDGSWAQQCQIESKQETIGGDSSQIRMKKISNKTQSVEMHVKQQYTSLVPKREIILVHVHQQV